MMSVKAARPAAPAHDRAAVFDTDLGWCALRFRDRAVARIAIGHESAADAVGALASFDDTSFLDVARRLSRFAVVRSFGGSPLRPLVASLPRRSERIVLRRARK